MNVSRKPHDVNRILRHKSSFEPYFLYPSHVLLRSSPTAFGSRSLLVSSLSVHRCPGRPLGLSASPFGLHKNRSVRAPTNLRFILSVVTFLWTSLRVFLLNVPVTLSDSIVATKKKKNDICNYVFLESGIYEMKEKKPFYYASGSYV